MEVIDVAVVVLDVIVELPLLLKLVLVIELGVRLLWVDLGSEVKTMKASKVKGRDGCVFAFHQAKMRNHLSKRVRESGFRVARH